MPRIFAITVLVLLIGGTSACDAMQFQQLPVGANDIVITARGPITAGDNDRLDQALLSVPSGHTVRGLVLNSPGGSIREAYQLTRAIRRIKLDVLIPSGAECSSACFLLFAAAPHRYAANDALIGVHSVTKEGRGETAQSLAITTLLARYAAELGVPPAIIGKMVQTTPGRIAWLTRADLASMGVVIRGGNAPAASPHPVAGAVQPEELGQFENWIVARHQETGRTVCYAFTRAETSQPALPGRGQVVVTIAERPLAHETVAIEAGFTYAADAKVTMYVDQAPFSFYTAQRNAFATNSGAVIVALRHGGQMTVRSPGPGDIEVTDTFSLKGFRAAYAAMVTACPPQ